MLLKALAICITEPYVVIAFFLSEQLFMIRIGQGLYIRMVITNTHVTIESGSWALKVYIDIIVGPIINIFGRAYVVVSKEL